MSFSKPQKGTLLKYNGNAMVSGLLWITEQGHIFKLTMVSAMTNFIFASEFLLSDSFIPTADELIYFTVPMVGSFQTSIASSPDL